MPAKFVQNKVTLAGRAGDEHFHLSCYDEGIGPAVVFVHGFPDLASGWQHQIDAVSNAGYRAIAPDMRGYGGSSCPQPVSAYEIAELCGDLIALLDKLDIQKAVFAGHDWGGFVVWAMAVLHPDRVQGVAAACTPYMPFPSVQQHLDVVHGEVNRQYVAWFQIAQVAETYMDQHVTAIVQKIMRTAPPLDEVYKRAFSDGKLNMNPFINLEDDEPPLGNLILDQVDNNHYIDAFNRTGFRGGINWYRNIDRNAAMHPEIGVQALDVPCLMLMADLDPALRPEFAKDMPDRCRNLEMHLIENAGHWVLREQASIVNDHLVSWLDNKAWP